MGTGDDSQFEANQVLNAKGRIAPLRDTFFLVMSGDEISTDVMGDFIDTCFNPVNLQFFIHKTMVDDGYEVLNEDYTRCYYEDKMANHLESNCLEPAVVNGQITSDYSMATNLFDSDFPQCIEFNGKRLPGPGNNYKPTRPKKPTNNYNPSRPSKPEKPTNHYKPDKKPDKKLSNNYKPDKKPDKKPSNNYK